MEDQEPPKEEEFHNLDRSNPLPPDHPLLYQAAQTPQRSNRQTNSMTLFETVPRWALISLVVSLLVIIALIPQFLWVLLGILRQTALILRVLMLPLAALFITLWLLRLFYPQNRS